MENLLMRYCRLSHGLNKKQVAEKLGLTLRQYAEIETGAVPITPKQATRLAKLYKTKALYFIEASDQLQTLMGCRAMMSILKSDNERLNELLEDGYALIHESKQRQSESYN